MHVGGFHALPGRSRGLQGPLGEAETSCGMVRLPTIGGRGGHGWDLQGGVEGVFKEI